MLQEEAFFSNQVQPLRKSFQAWEREIKHYFVIVNGVNIGFVQGDIGIEQSGDTAGIVYSQLGSGNQDEVNSNGDVTLSFPSTGFNLSLFQSMVATVTQNRLNGRTELTSAIGESKINSNRLHIRCVPSKNGRPDLKTPAFIFPKAYVDSNFMTSGAVEQGSMNISFKILLADVSDYYNDPTYNEAFNDVSTLGFLTIKAENATIDYPDQMVYGPVRINKIEHDAQNMVIEYVNRTRDDDAVNISKIGRAHV